MEQDPLYKQLARQELLDVFEIIDRSLRVQSDETLKALLSRVQHLLPCQQIVAGIGRTRPRGGFRDVIKIVNVSFPSDWMALYAEKGYATIDPLVIAHFQQFTPQLWSEVFRAATQPRQKKFIKHAMEFDLSQGITLGSPVPHSRTASIFSFAGKDMAEHVRHTALLKLLLPHLHSALMRIPVPLQKSIDAQLSVREREIMQWLKEGKTNWEISRILHISERTVNFHVHNILVKLDVSNRSHAVAVAMSEK